MPTVISFANMKGGVGKTTMCVNLAFEFFIRGAKVLVIDNDPQFSATSALVSPTYYISEFIKKKDGSRLTTYNIYERPPKVAQGKKSKGNKATYFHNAWYLKRDSSIRMDLVASRIELYETLDSPSKKAFKLNKFVKSHCKDYEYVFIDCPPTPSVLTAAAFAASKYVLVPVKPDHFSTLGLPQFLRTLEEFKEDYVDEHQVQVLGVIFTDVPRHLPQEAKESMRRVQSTIKELGADFYVFRSRLSRLEVFRKSLWQARPVREMQGTGLRGKKIASAELESLHDEVRERISTLEEE